MAENSNIEWTDHTFNPWMGCTKVSAACDHCYAERDMSHRLKQVEWGPHADRRRTSPSNWQKPLKWNRQAQAAGRRFRVFCASLADVFDNHRSIKDEWRADLWELIRQTPNLDWLLLTKRPQNLRKYLPEDWGTDGYANVWLGTTVENQEEAGKRLWHLLDHNAAGHFVSCEPLLGSVDLTRVVYPGQEVKHEYEPYVAYDTLRGHMIGPDDIGLPKLAWVICGGESGPEARPMHPDWGRAMRDQCSDAGVPFLFKQWGEWSPAPMHGKDLSVILPDGTFLTGRNVMDRPEEPNGEMMWNVGKKAAGRSLDGETHDATPFDVGAE